MANDIVAAIGLALILEGVAYALFPEAMRKAAAMLFAEGEAVVRTVGLLAAVIGTICVIVARLAW